MEKFEPFDFKLTKLTGNQWDRLSMRHLLEQLLEMQGNPRHSIENRLILAFDRSVNSSVEFYKLNESIIIEALIQIALDPYQFTYWLYEFDCWGSIFVFPEGEYLKIEGYYEHPKGLGLREPDKAQYERELIKKASIRCDYRIKPNRQNPFAIGIDGELKIDVKQIKSLGNPKQMRFIL